MNAWNNESIGNYAGYEDLKQVLVNLLGNAPESVEIAADLYLHARLEYDGIDKKIFSDSLRKLLNQIKPEKQDSVSKLIGLIAKIEIDNNKRKRKDEERKREDEERKRKDEERKREDEERKREDEERKRKDEERKREDEERKREDEERKREDEERKREDEERKREDEERKREDEERKRKDEERKREDEERKRKLFAKQDHLYNLKIQKLEKELRENSVFGIVDDDLIFTLDVFF